MEDSIVKVEHLSHRYHIQWAIQDINFEIKEKRCFGSTRFQRSRQIHHNEYYMRRAKPDRGGGLPERL